jgi:opacity protein-like surface antigen
MPGKEAAHMSCRWFFRTTSLVIVASAACCVARVSAQTVLDQAVDPALVEALPPADASLDHVMPVAHHAPGSPAAYRWYLGLNGGWQERETVHEVDDARTFIEFDSGFLINAQLGYRFDVFRVEAEYSFMNNGVDRAGAAGFDTPSAGNVNLKAFMLNIYHDFQLFDWLWEPYVGAGIGIYQSEINSLYPEFFAGAGPTFEGMPVNTTSDMPLAYQFRGGMSRPIGQRTELMIGYRFFKGEELEFAAAPFASPASPTFHPDGAAIHSLEAGLRVRF